MTSKKSLARAAVVAFVITASLSACAGVPRSGGGDGGGGGVAYGASADEFKKAFADVAPIKINTQSPAAKGSPVGKNFEDYYAAVEEYSGGKITFDISWANAVAPAIEVDDALRDGRLDLGSVMAGSEPERYPTYAAISDSSFMGNGSPLEMVMASHGYITDMMNSDSSVADEFHKRGLKVIAPVFTGGINGIYCSEPKRDLASLEGAQVRVSGSAHTAEAKALGMTPVSLAYAEVYEALQRGVIDCAFAGATVVLLGDLLAVAPHAILDYRSSFGQVPSAFAMSEAKWDELPLVAQQLLYDRADIFVQSNMEGLLDMFRQVIQAVPEKSGSIAGLDSAAQSALDKGNEDFLASIADNKAITNGDKLLETIRTESAEWKAIVSELGYATDTDYKDLAAYLADNTVDFAPFMDKVRETAQAGRPS